MPTNVKNLVNRAVTYVTVVSTIAWSMGAALLVPVAVAVTIADGDVVQPSSALFGNSASAVYYVSGSTLRVYPHANVYVSWGYGNADGSANWSMVKRVSAADLAGYTQGNSMPFRDGSLFRGTATSLGSNAAEAVYLVSEGKLRAVQSAAVYQQLFSDASWKRVTWVPDDLLAKFNYPMGANVTDGAVLYNGMVVTDGTTKYVVWGGQKRAVASEAAYAANRYPTGYAVAVSAAQLASVTNGSSVTAAESALLSPGAGAPVTSAPAVAGALAVSGGTQPAATVYPLSATNLPYVNVTLTAGATPVTVNGLTFTRAGVGAAANFANLYLYEGSARLTSGRSISSTTNTVTFATTLTVGAGTSRTFTLMASLAAATPGAVNAFSLTGVDTAASVAGLPVAGNAMNHGSAAAGTVTVDRVGATLTNVKVGQQQATVARFTLAAATEDASIRRVILTHVGTISRSALSGFKLMQGTTTLATAAALDGNDRLVLDLPSYSLARGTTRTFDLYANTGSTARNNDTIRFYVDESTDIYAVGSVYGSGMGVTRNWENSTQTQTTTVEGGQMTISLSGPVASTFSVGSNDVNLMNFSMTSGVNSEVQNTVVELHRSTTDLDASDTDLAQYTDFKVTDVASGEVIAGPVDAASLIDIGTAAGLRLASTNRYNFKAGQVRNFKVTVDLGTTASTTLGNYFARLGTTGGASFSTTTGIKNVDNNQFISDIVPSTVQTGNNMTLAASGLTVGLAASPTTKNAIRGASGVDAAGFTLTAGQGSAVTITSIKLTTKVDSAPTGVGATFLVSDVAGDNNTAANTLASKVRLLVGGVQFGVDQALTSSANNFATPATVTFSGLNIVIPKGASKTVVAQIDIPSTASQDAIALDIAAVNTDIVAQDESGATVTSTATSYANGASATAASAFVVIQTAGEITAALDAASPVTAIVVGGQSNVELARYRFTTLYEEMKVTKLRINSSADGVDDAIVAVTVTYPTGTTGTATESKTVSLNANGATAGFADFSELNFVISKNSDAVLIVKADIASVGAGGEAGDSGDQPGVTLDFTGTQAAGTGNFQAYGAGNSTTSITDLASATTLTALAADVAGNTMVLRKTKPTIKTVAPGSTLLTVGERDMALVQVTADSAGSIDWTELTINVTGRLNSATIGDTDADTVTTTITTGTGTAAVSSLKLVDAANTTLVDGSTGTLTITNLAAGGANIRFEPASAQTIAAGATATYTIKGTVATVAANDSLLTRVAGTSTAVVGTPAVPVAEGTVDDTAANRDFIWSDRSATAHSNTTTDWTNGFKVKDMPSTYVGLSA